MMDALIASHVAEIRRRAALYGDELDGAFDGSTDVDGEQTMGVKFFSV